MADSVGLGKTFEALAVIKYYELRNDRVLVLCPKRLRDNWTLYKANDRRNVLAGDRFNYDVLNHTDLSRDGGLSGAKIGRESCRGRVGQYVWILGVPVSLKKKKK